MIFQFVSVILFYISLNAIPYEGYTGSFFRAAVPADITQGSPNPSAWGIPSATLSNSSCHIGQFFSNHNIVFGKCNLFSYVFHSQMTMRVIIDITFCGMFLSLSNVRVFSDDLIYR